MPSDTVYGFRPPNDLEEKIVDYRDAHGLNNSEAVRQLVREGLEDNRETMRWLSFAALTAYLYVYYTATNWESLALIGAFYMTAGTLWSVWPIWRRYLLRLKSAYVNRRERGSEAD